jgi:hypothetical protein
VPTLTTPSRTWVIVVSLEHARRGLTDRFIMVNHGKRAPLTRMDVGDGILVYSPRTAFPDGDPLKAIAIVGTVTGSEPEPSAVIPDGFRLRAELREVEPIALAQVRDHLPTSRLRFGCFDLPPDSAAAIWQLVPDAGDDALDETGHLMMCCVSRSRGTAMTS